MKKGFTLLFILFCLVAVAWFLFRAKERPPSPTQTTETPSQTTESTTLPPTTLPPTTTSPSMPPTTTQPPPSIAELFPPYRVTATLKAAVANLPKGYTGAVKYGKGGVFYRVVSPTGEAVRVEAEHLTLSAPPPLHLPSVDKATIENMANEWGFLSETDYLAVTSLYRLETYVFKKSPRGWVLQKRMDCSAGDLTHPTPTGQFQIEAKYTAIGKAGEYTCLHAVGFFGNYLYHSLPLSPDGKTALDPRMGARVSNGCIRLRTADSLWLYQTLPLKTTVVIF